MRKVFAGPRGCDQNSVMCKVEVEGGWKNLAFVDGETQPPVPHNRYHKGAAPPGAQGATWSNANGGTDKSGKQRKWLAVDVDDLPDVGDEQMNVSPTALLERDDWFLLAVRCDNCKAAG